MREGDVPTEVQEFGEILSTPVNGQLPLLVGGHAVNLWAWAYQERIGEELKRWLPLTSKDLDLVGTTDLLAELKRRFGGEYRLSGPRSPVVGQLVVTLGEKPLKIDVLRDVFGLSPKDLLGEGITLDLEVPEGAFKIRVVPLMVLFQAKVANLARLDQEGRNDAKHVQLLLLVARAYLAEYIEATEAGLVESRAAVAQLEQARTVVASKDALKCSASHGVDFGIIWPRAQLATATDMRIRNFVKHRLPPPPSGGEESSENSEAP